MGIAWLVGLLLAGCIQSAPRPAPPRMNSDPHLSLDQLRVRPRLSVTAAGGQTCHVIPWKGTVPHYIVACN
jgi:hypothetical protein